MASFLLVVLLDNASSNVFVAVVDIFNNSVSYAAILAVNQAYTDELLEDQDVYMTFIEDFMELDVVEVEDVEMVDIEDFMDVD